MKQINPQMYLATLLVLALSLSACSGQAIPGSQLFKGSAKEKVVPLKKLAEITPSIKTKVSWQVDTGAGMGENKLHPFVSNDTVYVAGGASASAWNTNNGKKQWQRVIGETISAGVNGTFLKDPATAGKARQLFIGTSNANAIALDAKDGKIQWIERLSSEIVAVSPSYNNRVVFRTIDGKLHGLNATTGELIWQRTQKTPALSIMGASVPVIVPPLVISGFDNGKVAAYSLQTGENAWEVVLALPQGNTELERITDIDGKINPLGNALFAASLNGSVNGINMEAGKSVWSRAFSSPTGVNVNTQGLYSNDDKGNVWKLNPQNGAPIWSMDDLQRRQPTVPAIIGDNLLLVGDKQGNLHWINAVTGKFVARTKGDPAGYSVEAEVSGRSAYVLGKSGMLSKLQILN